jgi:hypothetical protein
MVDKKPMPFEEKGDAFATLWSQAAQQMSYPIGSFLGSEYASTAALPVITTAASVDVRAATSPGRRRVDIRYPDGDPS